MRAKRTKRAVPAETQAFVHKRSLGQNFLTSAVVPGWMVAAAKITKGDTVLEIGPGTGRLTKALLEAGATVLAVEADERAVTELEQTFAPEIASGQLTVYHGDAREITPSTLGLSDHSFKVVANIPYYLSGFLFRLLLESTVQPHTLTFLIQKELAVRIARDKKESLLSLSVKAFGTPTYNKSVARGHFYPIPKVDSAILTVSAISRDRFIDTDAAVFFDILHLGLGKKRKQLLTNLTERYSREKLTGIFSDLGLLPKVRGEDVALPHWLALSKKLSSLSPDGEPG